MRVKGAVKLTAALLLVAMAVLGCSKSKSSSVTSPAAELNSGLIAAGTSFDHKFAAEGTFNYHCTIHSNMHGSIVVSAAASPGDSNVVMSGLTFVPSSLVVKPGVTVRWTNNDTVAHTVTSD